MTATRICIELAAGLPHFVEIVSGTLILAEVDTIQWVEGVWNVHHGLFLTTDENRPCARMTQERHY